LKITNGKIIMSIGVVHTLCAVSPFVFGRQFAGFAGHWFFRINDGFLDISSAAGGHMDYETFAAFWCFCFGIFLFPLGILLESIERSGLPIPSPFLWSYLAVILVGAYMIPAGGLTVLMLPHVVYMLVKKKKARGARGMLYQDVHGSNSDR
jgi:hypothetical protein